MQPGESRVEVMGDAARRERLSNHLMKQAYEAATSASVFQDNLEYEPCDDLLLVERSDAEVTVGGIIVPEAAARRHMPRFIVLKVGPGRYTADGQLVPMRCKVGDNILVQPDRGGGGCFSIPNSTTQVLISEGCVIAIIRERADA